MAISKKTKTEKPSVQAASKKSGTLPKIGLIKHPRITEKSYLMSLGGRYVFLVDKSANKPEIKKAVETLYNVTVTNVNTVNVRGEYKRFRGVKIQRPSLKKAVVTLKEGQKIDVMPT